MTGPVRAAIGVTLAAAGCLLAAFCAPASAAEQTRYSLVHGCYTLKPAGGGGELAKSDGGYVAGGRPAEVFRMQATDLGKYLLYGSARDFLALDGDAVISADEPSDDADWTVRETSGAFTLVNEHAGRALAVGDGGTLVGAEAASADRFEFAAATGCPQYPEVEVGARGRPSTGSPSYGEVSGLVEGHMHGMAFEFLGGKAHCGRPWHRFGAPYALRDCADHEIGNGCAAVLENVLYGNPARCHDPVGWPTFNDWPDPKSLTHEQSYWRWLERAWRGGLRVYVNLFVENRILCQVYPYKQNDCDEMQSVLLQARRIREMQDYIDAQAGGPGKGFFRIVSSPYQARRVINRGKLAVIQGMEVSEPFGCKLINGQSMCDRADINEWLDRLHTLGVRQLEITNKFDNALTGVAGDSGTTGTLVDSANFLATGSFWDLGPCEDPTYHDHSPTTVNYPHNDDLILSNGIEALLPGGAVPVYPSGPVCNTRGLSPLGEQAIRGIMRRKMIFDPDHMSVIGREAALNLVESRDYSGIVSSHSWSTDDALPRIYELGGVITPYAGSSTDFVHEWEHLREVQRTLRGQYFGVGYGADMNGFGSQGLPRGADVSNPVTYPFRSFDGKVKLEQQRSGERVYDINVDGVAHYGLYPDWVEDLRMLAGDRIIGDLGRGAEAYLQMWERAEGVEEVRCDIWRKRFLVDNGFAKGLQLGQGPKRALRRAGQPVSRSRVWRWCANGHRKPPRNFKAGRRHVAAAFTPSRRVGLIVTTLHKHRAAGVRPGMPKRELRGGARGLGGGVFLRRTKSGTAFVYGVKGNRVRYVGVASREVAESPVTLKRYLRRAE